MKNKPLLDLTYVSDEVTLHWCAGPECFCKGSPKCKRSHRLSVTAEGFPICSRCHLMLDVR